MWKCAICNKENQENDLICRCGFDRSIDYENFRTIVKLDLSDFQNYQKMQDTVQNKIQLEIEVQKDLAEKEQSEEENQFVENEQSEEENQFIENELEEDGEKELPTATDSVILKKTISPKTKLDWLMLGIGVIIACGFIYGKHYPVLYYFKKNSFCSTIGDIFDFLSDGFLLYFVLTVCYMVMNKSLGAIQYNKKKKQVMVYALSSVLPLCYLGDIIWGGIISSMSYRQQHDLLFSHREILPISWFVLYFGILLLALIEKPEKILAKEKARKENGKARNISIFPQTKLQTLVFVMGIALVVIFPTQDTWIYTLFHIRNAHVIALISWNLLYWLGKCLRNVSKYIKTFVYAVCSIVPLLTFYSEIYRISQISGAGEPKELVKYLLLVTWVLIIVMAIKEEPTSKKE